MEEAFFHTETFNCLSPNLSLSKASISFSNDHPILLPNYYQSPPPPMFFKHLTHHICWCICACHSSNQPPPDQTLRERSLRLGSTMRDGVLCHSSCTSNWILVIPGRWQTWPKAIHRWQVTTKSHQVTTFRTSERINLLPGEVPEFWMIHPQQTLGGR